MVRLRCMCLKIHAPTDLRLEEMDVADPGPGEVLVKVAMGGICGSDLHYYRHGGFGTIRIQEPMVLGHEVAVQLINEARLDFSPVVSHTFGLRQATEAFELASDRQKSMKVLLDFALL